MSPANDLPSQDLPRQYDLRFARLSSYRDAVWKILTRQYFARLVPAQADVLDLGCGWGEFINNISAGRKFAMDLNPESAGHLAENVCFLRQDCSQTWALDDASLDVVFTSNFFEHLPSKEALSRSLGQAYRCLRPGGQIMCMGPNIKYLPGRYWDFFDHYLPLTELALKEALELRGFKVTRALDRFLPYTMAVRKPPPLWTLSCYLRMPFVWRFFGKQFLVIGRRPLP